jgi:putative endonuclease
VFYVYIIKSKKNGRLYKGCTTDLKNRISEHNRGETKSTKAYLPWVLVYYEAFANKTDALREELFLKSGKGKERLKYLLANTLQK